MKPRIGRIVAYTLMVIIAVVAVVANVVVIANRAVIDQQVIGTRVDKDADQIQADANRARELAATIEAEGAVLVKNDGALPLTDQQVNVFGWGATQWVGGGSGSGTSGVVETDFLAALTEAGVDYNQQLIDMYRDFQDERPFSDPARATLNSDTEESSRLYEPAIDDERYYTAELLSAAQDYSDTAIMVVNRFAGESSDLPKVQYKMTESGGQIVTDESRTYLDFSTEEEGLLSYLANTYDTVIVIVNSPNPMSLKQIADDGVGAALLVGTTGTHAATAIPDLLYGRVNPSGKLADTYPYELASSSTYLNSGETGIQFYTNGQGYYPADGTIYGNTARENALYEGVGYVDYVESIYVGYRWFETADAEGYWDSVSNQFGTGYDGIVQYPFGFGLSYTTFDWTLDSATRGTIDQSSTIDVTVTVTNTGDVAGKDVVELYYGAPYTPGGIEKSAVNLGDYAKTQILEPGESEQVTLSFDVADMASYDAYDANTNGFAGYELEAGDYELSLRTDSHTPKQMASGVWNVQVTSGITMENDPVTGQPVSNVFTGSDAVDGISIDGSDSDAGIVYLSRADFPGTVAQSVAAPRAMTQNLIDTNLYTQDEAEAFDAQPADQITTDAENGLTIWNGEEVTELGFQLGANYDDPSWDTLLDQMSVEEMENLVLHAYTQNAAIESVGKPALRDIDGPTQVASFAWSGGKGEGYPSTVILAQTWNKDLAEQFGLVNGIQAGNLGYSGWYAPGVNLHRSAFGGRNYEYYSEDPYLSGVNAGLTIQGAKQAGIYTFVKHYAVYDGETNRDGLYTWLTEQALREIYIKPFQIIVEDYDATGMMTAYNRVGAIWAGGSKALLELPRNEWGYHGTYLTDYADHHVYMNGDQMLRNGGDIWMDGWLSDGTFTYPSDSAAFQSQLRRAAKNMTYTWLNARAANVSYNATADQAIEVPNVVSKFRWWIPVLVGADLVIVAGLGLWLRFLMRRSRA